MTGALTHDNVINYFSNHVEKYSKENNIDNKSLLLVDNAPAHPQLMEDWCVRWLYGSLAAGVAIIS